MRWQASMAAVVCGVLALASPVVAQRELNQRIQAAIASSKVSGAKFSVSVRDLSSGVDLADLDADAPMKPASNMKLLTSGAALLVLGTDFSFRTELVLEGPPGSERLIIVGSGDPALADPTVLDRMTPKVTVESLISQLAGAVKTAGVTRVTEVVVDDRVFDRQWVHPTWPRNQLDKWYCAPVAGVNFHANVLCVYPSPSADGDGRPPQILIQPSASWIEIDNRAKTILSGNNSFWMSRQDRAEGENRFTLFGQVRQPAKQPMEITLADVAKLTGQLIAVDLVRQGVAVGRGEASREAALRAVRMAEMSELFRGRTIAAITTHMPDILSRCNSDSHNLYAEALIKRMGREVTGEPGSWTNGSSVVRMTIGQAQRLGPRDAAATVVVDGSGLSKENRVSARSLTRWLDEMQRDRKIGAAFIESLATPRTSGSNLRRRFEKAGLTCSLNAKTGTIDEVRCLSGYLTDPRTGNRYAFSIMINGLRENMGDGPEALACQDRIVGVIDRWISGAGTRANVTDSPR
jgi:D-alanyl-D-alanine carboxypeptidase/D-alanyl-D-alanine-endopeptidase (penicillin-binding protein 4)